MCILVPAREICPACSGRGSVAPYQCWRCDGHGTLMDEYPVMVSYPAGLQQDYIVHLSLDRFGIGNFYLTVRFRPSELYGEERSERDPAKQIGEKLGPLSQSDPYSVNLRQLATFSLGTFII